MSEASDARVPRPVRDQYRVGEIAAELRAAGRFALDLEFVSESRYVPELCLVQVGWGDPDAPAVAAIDPLATDPLPVLELVADPAVEVVLHSAQGDLSLLGTRLGIAGERIVDTQIAAAFLGLGDQLGYAALVEALRGVEIDKAHQFTDWCRRPLSDEQLRYALDDVRHLPAIWRELSERLAARGRLDWVAEESAAVARTAASRTEPHDMFRRIRGHDRLKPAALGALRALAAWREREALASNRPPSWLVKDPSLVEIARRLPERLADLQGIRGLSDGAVRRHGPALVEAVLAGRADPPPSPPRLPRLPAPAKGWGSLVLGLVQARCREADIAPRFVASRSEADRLVHWWIAGGADGAPGPDLPLLSGWRRELAGQAALDWLGGQTAIAVDPGSPSGLRLVES